MSWWGLLIEVFVVWLLWGVAALMGRMVCDARRGVPEDQRGGVSIAPAIPLFPLVFWGVARLVDLVITPWGTLIVVWFHAVLGIVFLTSIARDTWRLWSLGGPA